MKKYDDGFEFRVSFQKYEHRGKSIRIKFREESGFLFATLCPGLKREARKIDLFEMPSEYWEIVDIVNDDPLSEFMKIIIDKTKKLSEGKGIKARETIG